MALTPRLEFRQTQSLVMTPQLMQAIKLLQLSNLDLVAYVETELERNPLLEREEEPPDGPAAGADAERDPTVRAEPAGEEGERGEAEAAESEPASIDAAVVGPERTSEIDVSLSELFPDDTGAGALDPGRLSGDPWSAAGRGGEDADLEAFVASERSLRDHLLDQLALAVTDPTRRLIGQFLVDSLDEAGYLRIDMAAAAEQLGADPSVVEEMIAVLQGCEPTGIGARDLAECLALQLAERDRYDPAMRALVAHLDIVARRDYAQLRRLCGVDDEDLADMLGELRSLNPKPGLAFGAGPVQTVVPDVIVRPVAEGGFRIELNADTLPRVLVNRSYYSTVSKTAMAPGERAYLSECLQTANWLVKSLDQRARTILKVATEIVRQQSAFLQHGVAHLRPLNLRTVADEIGMHESTVSRVTANKYMATTRGIFELKYFFTSAIAAADGGDSHSAEAVRHRIRQLIDAEPADAVLSDDTIVQLLRNAGIDIARRTVAKYRESMRIPSSVERRRDKRAMARQV
jgi:RNA polymerase sigma-54 factor